MRLIRFFASLACFCLVLGLLFTVIDVCSFDHSFYVKEFQDNDTSAATGMSSEDNLAASDVLLDYLRGNCGTGLWRPDQEFWFLFIF